MDSSKVSAGSSLPDSERKIKNIKIDLTSKPESKNSRFMVVKIHELAKKPTRGSELAAGYDLSSVEDCKISVGGRKAVATGLKIRVPSGTYGRVAPRSGLAFKYGIDVGAGVIDEDYRGEVKVILFNHGDKEFEIKAGDRIAQLVLEKIVYTEVESVDDLSDTDRGIGGFGSTGNR